MDLAKFFNKTGKGSISSLSKSIGAFQSDMSRWAKGLRPVPIHWCITIEEATNGEVTRKDLRPDDWHLIWPELKQKAGK